jgi:hypothetical protein
MRTTFAVCLAMLLLAAFDRVQATMRKAPYLTYSGTNTEMEVHWQLTTTGASTIDWGSDTTYTLGSCETAEYDTSHQHRYTVADLTPGDKYYYRVTANQQRFAGSFRAAPDAGASTLKFMAYGDSRSYPAVHDTVANAMLNTVSEDSGFQSLVISVGDLVLDGTAESNWDSEFFNPAYAHLQALVANLPYQSCIGNHEGNGTLYVKYFAYPFVAGRYWSFDYGPAHFAVVDQWTDYRPGSAQLTWLTNDLAASSRPWKFVVLHQPGWSAGGGHEDYVNVQNHIQPLCEQYGVSIVFAGHNHYYSRAVVNGVQHITTGGGGAELYIPNPNYPNIVATSRTHHFCKVAIDGDELLFTAITSSGAVIDSFSMFRAVPRAPQNLVIRLVPSSGTIQLDWTPVLLDTSNNPISSIRYVIDRSANLTSWDSIGSPTPPDTSVYVDSTALEAGRSFFYQIRAVKD